MAKAAQKSMRVRMACAYTGDGWTVNAGDVAEVAADEAARLVALGAAAIEADAPSLTAAARGPKADG